MKDIICQALLSDRTISIKETELIIYNLSKPKAPSLYGFMCEFHRAFKKEIIPILYNLFQKTEAEGILSELF